MKRLTQPMRQFLQNLVDGKPADTDFKTSVLQTGSVNVSTIAQALRKRGLVEMQRDATFKINQQGRDALAQAKKGLQ